MYFRFFLRPPSRRSVQLGPDQLFSSSHRCLPFHRFACHRSVLHRLVYAMERITPLDIPLINREIYQYLSPKDLSRCTLVSKAWSAWFSSALWRDLDCSRTTPDLKTLSGQQEHVRIVSSLPMEIAGTLRDQLFFPHLQRLEFSYTWSRNGIHRVELRVLRVLERIQTLQHLKISLSLDHHDVHQQWIQTLRALTRLRKLELSCHQYVGGMAILEFLQLCHRYEYLGLNFLGHGNHITQEDREECQVAKAAIEEMQGLQLSELSLNTSFELLEEFILQPLLERCPLVEKLYLWRPRREQTLHQLMPLFRSKRFPKLRHWRTHGFYGRDEQEAHAELLSSIGGGLESFMVDTDPDKAAAKVLIQCHAHSLTKLDLNGVLEGFVIFSDLMTGLPGLRSVKARVRPMITDTDEELDVLAKKEWACIGLNTLSLFLDTSHGSSRVIGGRYWKGSKSQRCLDITVSWIARLKNLEDLRMGCCQADLFLLKRGYLSQLENLRQLKLFDLDRTPHNNFGEKEAVWMIHHWPRLVQINDRGAPWTFRMTLLATLPLLEFVENRM